MECEKYKEFLWDYCEGKVVKKEVIEHIGRCKKCGEEVEKIKKILKVLYSLREDIPEPVEIKENVLARIRKRRKLKERIRRSSFILSPVFIALLIVFINIYKREKMEIVYPEEVQILTPEEVYFVFKIPENAIFFAEIDTHDITDDLKFMKGMFFYDAKNFEADPGFHTLVIKILNEEGEIVKEFKRNFYLTDYKVAEIFPEY